MRLTKFLSTDAKSRGASVLLGGAAFQPDNLPGYFMQPTVLGNVPAGTICSQEETFAPVVALQRFKTEEEAVEIANDCDVGLGSYIMTQSMSRTFRVAESLEVGMVGVNQGLLSACESPFGGESRVRDENDVDWFILMNSIQVSKSRAMGVKAVGTVLTSILPSRVF